jgi:hypothetical protein
MPQTVLLAGPVPPAPSVLFCSVCAATWKFAAYQRVRERSEAAAHSREDGLLRLPLTAGPPVLPPQPAVAWGFFGPFLAPPLGSGFYPGIVPLCWTHLLMLEDRAGGIIPSAALPDDVLRGGVALDRR